MARERADALGGCVQLWMGFRIHAEAGGRVWRECGAECAAGGGACSNGCALAGLEAKPLGLAPAFALLFALFFCACFFAPSLSSNRSQGSSQLPDAQGMATSQQMRTRST